ncbi:PIG-L deacetylase family protein [Desulfovibrio sp. UCD-KL4C]|uniref:PIG-L deacetylase family protein n=1 Tax=Desulfovibrio sp. UCD-KL4C TaxID=2578120 RepID=UPI0025B97383|nr:PIG-L family deacetylase [Desulfovibrio sp. UCD-KL4C]
MNHRILTIAAHPDDEILGCGATVARMINNGAEAYTLILGEGVTSRQQKRETSQCAKELRDLKKSIQEANKIIGVKKVITYDFPDNRFDSVNLLELVKIVEKVKNEIKPDIIFTHFANDMNIDHYITNKAVLTATRPMQNEVVKEIYAFEILSSTEWNFPLTFSPDYFVNVDETIETKLKAMSAYKGELQEYPHPRSLKALELNADLWGIKTGNYKVEAFQTLRRLWI